MNTVSFKRKSSVNTWFQWCYLSKEKVL